MRIIDCKAWIAPHMKPGAASMASNARECLHFLRYAEGALTSGELVRSVRLASVTDLQI